MKYINIKSITLIGAMTIVLNFMTGCSSDNKQDGLHYGNDFESLKGWTKAATLVKGEAHSGSFALKTDSVESFSHSFSIKINEISNKPIKKVKYSMYCMFKNINAKANMVLLVDKPDGSHAFWSGVLLHDYIKEVDKWVKVTGEVNLEKTGSNNPENTLVMYLWNNSKEVIYADDFELEFIE